MVYFIGWQGTKFSLVSRAWQILCAAVALDFVLYATPEIFHGLRFSILVMFAAFQCLQVSWNAIVACVDLYAICKGKDLRTFPCLYAVIIFGDIVTSYLWLTAVASMVGRLIFLTHDLGVYNVQSYNGSLYVKCIVFSIAGLISCILSTLSGLINGLSV